jgi:hypothetical protein
MTDEETIRRLSRSIDVLEEWKGELNVERAGEKVRMKNIDDSLQDIKKAFWWLISIVGGSALVAFTQFVLNGGFNIPT